VANDAVTHDPARAFIFCHCSASLGSPPPTATHGARLPACAAGSSPSPLPQSSRFLARTPPAQARDEDFDDEAAEKVQEDVEKDEDVMAQV